MTVAHEVLLAHTDHLLVNVYVIVFGMDLHLCLSHHWHGN